MIGGKTRARRRLERVARDLEAVTIGRRTAIRIARKQGLTWREIGDALGMSPSGAAALVARPPEKVEHPAPTLGETWTEGRS